MNRWRLAGVPLLLLGIAAAGYFLPLADWTTTLAERARNTGPWGVGLFSAAYVVSTVLFLPGSFLTFAAGFVYGPAGGIAIASPASVSGATCAFLLGRTLLRGWAAARADESPPPASAPLAPPSGARRSRLCCSCGCRRSFRSTR